MKDYLEKIIKESNALCKCGHERWKHEEDSARDQIYYMWCEESNCKCKWFKEAPLISIYTPTYNRNQLLRERAIPTVLAQTYTNFEYLIIHDGLEDNDLGRIIESYDDPRIKYFKIKRDPNRYPPSKENDWLAGPVIPSNKALEEVKGDWICRLDDDDTWTKDHLEVLLKFALEGEYDFVSAQYEAIRYGNKEIVGADERGIGGIQTWLYKGLLKHFKYDINCWKKKWNRVNDIDLSIRMWETGVRMGFLEQVLAFCYPRPNEETIGSAAI